MATVSMHYVWRFDSDIQDYVLAFTTHYLFTTLIIAEYFEPSILASHKIYNNNGSQLYQLISGMIEMAFG